MMWASTPDEQTWLTPSKEWTLSVMAAELAKRAGQPEMQLQLPLPMPAPYDDFITDPQIMVAK
jgi:hypothetical protein